MVLGVVALVGGALVHASVDLLPSSYSWLQPYHTLSEVVEMEGFPLTLLLGYLLGWQARHRWQWRSFRAALVSGERMSLLVRGLAFALGMAFDVLLFEAHHPVDSVALGVLAALVTRPSPVRDRLQFLASTLTGLLVFCTVCYWFTVVKALTLLDREPLDGSLIAFESLFSSAAPHRTVAIWSAEHPQVVEWFDWAYFRLFHHMAVTLAVLVGLRDVQRRARYVAALAICYFVGAPLYLLFPGLGPVYYEQSLFGYLERPDLLTSTMQQILYRNTVALHRGEALILSTWGYIACMPSLHMAHELVMTVAVWPSRVAFALSAAFTALTAVAVVGLGWHYPTDILGGFILGGFAWKLAGWLNRHLLPDAQAAQGAQLEGSEVPQPS